MMSEMLEKIKETKGGGGKKNI